MLALLQGFTPSTTLAFFFIPLLVGALPYFYRVSNTRGCAGILWINALRGRFVEWKMGGRFSITSREPSTTPHPKLDIAKNNSSAALSLRSLQYLL